MKRIFIDGSAGTTGLRIRERLAARQDIELVTLPEELRKNDEARREMLMEGCDIAFLCLPDEASRKAMEMIGESGAAVLDTSTAHRTDPRFVYGFPELSAGQRAAIASSRRIAVPGCHASGFIALTAPLVQAGLLPRETALTCFSLTGYSGGGKSMIAQYETQDRDPLLKGPRQYGLTQEHKHLREMVSLTGLAEKPVFCPIVADFYSGMEVTVPLFRGAIRGSAEDIRRVYAQRYAGPVVRYRESAGEGGFLSAAALSGTDGMEISVLGGEERILLTARYDNLGKGASGAAVQCLNLLLGVSETTGLVL